MGNINTTFEGVEKLHKAMGHLINNNQKMLKALQNTTKAVKQTGKSVNETTHTLYSLNQAQDAVNKTNESFIRNIAASADGVGKYSKRWTMFSRILSGSVFWKLQNYARFAGQSMNYFYTKSEDATKAANEQAMAMGELTKNIDAVNKQIGILNKVGNHKELIESNLEYKNSFEALIAAGETEANARKLALSRTKNMYDSTLKKLQGNLKKEGQALQKALELENKMREKSEAKKLKKEAKAALKKANFRKKDLRQYIKMQNELEKLQAKSARTKEGGFTKAEQTGATKAVKRQGSKLGGFATQAGLNKDLVKYAKLMNKHETIKQKATRYFMKTGKGIMGVLKIVGKVMMIALKFSMYFMLFILGAFLIFSVIREIFKKAEVMEVIMDTLRGVFEGVFEVLSGVFDIFGAFFGGGTFGERLEKLLGGFGKIFGGLGKIIFSVMKGIVKIGVQLLVAAIGLVIDIAIAVIKGLPSFIMQTIPKVLGKIRDFIFSLPSKIWHKMVDIKNSIQEYLTKQVKKITDKLPSAKGIKDKAKKAGGKVKSFFGLHTGGFTKGGFNLVGERGPELVRLPLGSRVFSNDNSKSMMGRGNTNNITINVNGRLGASDSELRDIAKKIGSMVSTEINRTTSSSTNVRF